MASDFKVDLTPELDAFGKGYKQHIRSLTWEIIGTAFLGNGENPNIIVVPADKFPEFPGALYVYGGIAETTNIRQVQNSSGSGIIFENVQTITEVVIGYPEGSKIPTIKSISNNGLALTGGATPQQIELNKQAINSPDRWNEMRLIPSSPASMTPRVTAGEFRINDVNYRSPEDFDLTDITAMIPSDPDTAVWVGVSLNVDLTPNYVLGAEFDTSDPDIASHLPTDITAGKYDLGYVLLYNGQTGFAQADFIPKPVKGHGFISLPDLPDLAAAPAAGDLFLVYDDSTGLNKFVSFGNLGAAGGFLSSFVVAPNLGTGFIINPSPNNTLTLSGTTPITVTGDGISTINFAFDLAFTDGIYLRLNASNSPLTGALTINTTTTPQLTLTNTGKSVTFSTDTAGALTLTPQAGQNFNLVLSTTGDLAVNTNQLYVDTSANLIGYGTATPLFHHDSNTDGAQDFYVSTSFGSGIAANFIGRTARGTQASPTATGANDTLVNFGGRGYFDTGTGSPAFASASSGIVRVRATEAFTATARGTEILFLTTPKLSATNALIATFTDTGDLLIGTTSNSFNSRLFLDKTYTSTSGTDVVFRAVNRVANASSSSGSYYGFLGGVIIASGTTQNITGTLYGLLPSVDIDGSGTVTTINNLNSQVIVRGTKNVSTIHVNLARLDLTGSGTITDAYLEYIQAPSNTGGATITTLYGLYIENISGGTTNHALMTNLGKVTLNNGNGDADFEWKGDTLSAMLYGDASVDRVGNGTSTPSTNFHSLLTDAATNTVVNVVTIGHNGGSVAAGFGTGLIFEGESSTTNNTSMGRLYFDWQTATHASRKARGYLSVFDTAERVAIEWEASGTAPMVGFFGVNPVIQPATTGTTTGFTAATGTAVLSGSTFTGNTGAAAYTIGDIVLALKQVGLLAA